MPLPVKQWLEQLGLGEYAEAFEENAIRPEHLQDLDHDTLKEIGVQAVGHRMTILKAAAALREGPPTSVLQEPGPAAGGQPESPSIIEAERRQLTVMFCDLVDSTRLSVDLDPEEVRELNKAYRKLCTDTIRRYEGYIARYMGDGVLAYFGYPRAHEDDASSAVRAGLDITSAAPQLASAQAGVDAVAVRVGIATGPVVVGELIGEGAAQEHDVVGETPNLAARLQGLAAANSVMIAEDTRKLLGAAFELENLGEKPLKGFTHPVRVWRVIGTAFAETRFDASRSGGLTPFVGRDHETALITDSWQRALDGDGQVVLISGEAGIGKSRITMMTRERLHAHDYIPVRLQCSPYHQSSALYPLVEHLQRAAQFVDGESPEAKLHKLERLLDLAEADAAETMAILAALLSIPVGDRYPRLDLDPDVLRERTLELLLGQLQSLSRQRPLLFLIEDVHWADPTTLALLNGLVERVRSWRALLLITFRPDFRPPWTGEAHVSLLSLNRLDRRQCESMITRLTEGRELPEEIVDQIALKTDGVPLFVEELTKTIIESGLVVEKSGRYVLTGPMQPLAIPTTLQDSLMARLDQLDEAKSLAQIGAAIGREFSRTLLEALSESRRIDQALSRLVDSGLVLRRGTGARTSFVFKHALIQDAAYNSMLKSRRHALHGRIAEVLLRDFPDIERSQPELLAQHYAAAGLHDRALPYWRAAGRHAMERSAYEEAISHFRRGLDCVNEQEMDDTTAGEAVELRTSIAECLRTTDRMDEAFTTLQLAEDVAHRFDLATYLARIHHQRGNLYFPTAKTEECLAEHQQALEYAQTAGSVEEEVRALGGLGDAYYLSGRMRTAKHYFGRCVDLAREHGFAKTAAANLSMRGFSRFYLLEIEEALQDGLDATASAREAGHPRAEMLGHVMQCYCNYYMGNFERAIENCEVVRDAVNRLGARRFGPQNDYYVALCLYRLGQKEKAMDLLDRAEPVSRRNSLHFSLVRVLSGIALITDDPGRRERALLEAEELLASGTVSHNHFAFCLDATEGCFEHAEWDRMEYYADRQEAYTREEPLPWSDLVISRARALAQWGRGNRSREVMERLRALRNQASEAGLQIAINPIDKALAAEPSHHSSAMAGPVED